MRKRYGTYRKRKPSTRYTKRKPVSRYRKRRIPRSVTTLSNIPTMQKLRYVTNVYISASGGTPASHSFRANSLYDPDYTGTGHQPMRFDQLATFFARYIVVGAKITVSWQGTTADAEAVGAPAVCMIQLDDNGTPGTDFTSLIEQGKCKYMLINDIAGRSPKKISQTFSAKKFFNISNIKDNMEPYGALVSTNPADDAYFHITLQSLLGTTGGISVTGYFLVVIDFIALFSEPITLAQS